MFHETRTIADLTVPGLITPGWTINRINVPVQHRGQGLGTQMLKLVTSEADLECVSLWLEVMPSGPLDHQALTAWYRRNGFRTTRCGYMMRQAQG